VANGPNIFQMLLVVFCVHVYVFYHLILRFTLYCSVYDFTSLCKYVRLSCVFIINLLTYLLTNEVTLR